MLENQSTFALLIIAFTILSALLAFLCGSFLTVHLHGWLQKRRKLPIFWLIISIGISVFSPVARVATIVGAISGVVYLLIQGRSWPRLSLIAAWISMVSGGLLIVGAWAMFFNNLALLLPMFVWGVSSSATGVLLYSQLRPQLSESPHQPEISLAASQE